MLTLKSTLLDLKPKRANLALTPSSAPTAKEITKLTPMTAHFGGIASTGNGTSKSTPRSVKTGLNLSVLMQMAANKL